VVDANALRPSLIIVDTLRRVIAGDENKAEDVGRLTDLLEYLGEYCQCPVIGLTHPPKAGKSSASGSNIYITNARWEAVLEKDAPGTITLKVEKIDTSLPSHLNFKIREVSLAACLEERGITLDPDLEGASAGYAEYLPDAGRDTTRRDAKVTDTELLQYLHAKPHASHNDIAVNFGVTRPAIKKRLERLVKIEAITSTAKPFRLTKDGEKLVDGSASASEDFADLLEQL